MTPAQARELVAAAAGSALPGWSTYAEPPDPQAVAAPAVIVGPGAPYLAPAGFRSRRLRLRLTLVVPRVGWTMTQLEDAALGVWAALDATADAPAVTAFAGVGEYQDPGASPQLAAVLELETESEVAP